MYFLLLTHIFEDAPFREYFRSAHQWKDWLASEDIWVVAGESRLTGLVRLASLHIAFSCD
jgi:hypothetical protein